MPGGGQGRSFATLASACLGIASGALLLLGAYSLYPWPPAPDLPLLVRLNLLAGLLGYLYTWARASTLVASHISARYTGLHWQKPKEGHLLLISVLTAVSTLVIYGATVNAAGSLPAVELPIVLLLGIALLLIPYRRLRRRLAILIKMSNRAGSLDLRIFQQPALPSAPVAELQPSPVEEIAPGTSSQHNCRLLLGNRDPHFAGDEQRLTYHNYLNNLLSDTIDLCTIIPLRHKILQSASRPTAILFVPHPELAQFVPVAVRSTSDRYSEIAWKLRPPFMQLEEFVAIYNRYCDEATGPEARNINPGERLRQFRKDTKRIVSTCAIIAGRGKHLLFENVFDNCLTFSFEFLADIHDREERQRLQFRPLAAIPARFDGTLLGILLLLGDKSVRFSHEPALYEQVQDLLGHALEIGRTHSLVPGLGNEALASAAPFVYRSSFCKLINTMNHRFDMKVSSALLDETREALLREQSRFEADRPSFGTVRLKLQR